MHVCSYILCGTTHEYTYKSIPYTSVCEREYECIHLETCVCMNVCTCSGLCPYVHGTIECVYACESVSISNGHIFAHVHMCTASKCNMGQSSTWAWVVILSPFSNAW